MIPDYLLYYYGGLLYAMFPVYFANMMPVFVKKIPFLDVPMDFGKKYKGIRLLGNNKTWRGLIAAVIGAAIIFKIQVLLYPLDFFTRLSIVNYTTMWVWLGAMLGLGAILGDAVKSFFKRRKKIKPGKSWMPFDQIDYTLGALLFAYPWMGFKVNEVLFIVIVSAVLHMAVNYIGFLLGINKSKL